MDNIYHNYSWKDKYLSLRVILPASIFIALLIIIGLSLMLGSIRSTREYKTQSMDYLQREVARLTRLAAGTIRFDPQLLEDSITQLSTNPMVKYIAVIKPDGAILFSNQFSLRGKDAATVLPNFSAEDFLNVQDTRLAEIKYIEQQQQFLALMSFIYPGEKAALRDLGKGVVYLSYDISDSLSQAGYANMTGKLPELLFMLALAIILSLLLHYYIALPLAEIREASRNISSGKFDSTITTRGPIEIQQLAVTFNNMKRQLANTISDLDRHSSQMQGILDNTFDGIISIDADGRILSFNKTAESIFGMEAHTVLGKNVNVLMPNPYHDMHDKYLENYLHGGTPKIVGVGREVEGKRADGSIFPMDLAVTEIVTAEGSQFIGIIRDITDRKQKELETKIAQAQLAEANRELEYLVRTDSLTQVANRRMFDETIPNEFKRAMRQGSHISLLLFDVDYFKKYNDHYGHPEGDACLVKVAQAARQLFKRSGELVARYGGEEFVVVMPNTDLAHAEASAAALLEKVQQLQIPHEQSPITAHVTISIGISSLIPDMSCSETDLIQVADSALYAAKKNGRNRYAIATEAPQQNIALLDSARR
ncbi:MAG: diguanylate cyclase [Gammaproteobacteria bacterium]|nr:diguanylate cyclase [Gammaproteobacteria bacterium]MDH5650574.1 diguanylate cyclase [Gammaproteobacteria bacterium]